MVSHYASTLGYLEKHFLFGRDKWNINSFRFLNTDDGIQVMVLIRPGPLIKSFSTLCLN